MDRSQRQYVCRDKNWMNRSNWKEKGPNETRVAVAMASALRVICNLTSRARLLPTHPPRFTNTTSIVYSPIIDNTSHLDPLRLFITTQTCPSLQLEDLFTPIVCHCLFVWQSIRLFSPRRDSPIGPFRPEKTMTSWAMQAEVNKTALLIACAHCDTRISSESGLKGNIHNCDYSSPFHFMRPQRPHIDASLMPTKKETCPACPLLKLLPNIPLSYTLISRVSCRVQLHFMPPQAQRHQ